MTTELQQYWQAVEEEFSTKCINSDGHGNCLLPPGDECVLKFHFPKIVETVRSVKSENMEPYIEALRCNVCAYCKHQSPDGKCILRVNLECCLDRYFPLIVEAIEKADATEYLTCHVN
ncbi:MAG: hypothetical protein HYR67_18425 [Bacteroidetes bacterium]|nr:hypothetical protein [Bacteroidota bacterium]